MGRLKFNNLSNATAPIIAFNVDNILFMPKKRTDIVEKVLRFFSGNNPHYDYFHRDISLNGIDVINNCWLNNEVSVHLLTFTDYSSEIEEILYEQNVYFSRLQKVEGMDWLRRKCRYQYAYYFDTNDSLISELSINNAQKISDIYKYLKV